MSDLDLNGLSDQGDVMGGMGEGRLKENAEVVDRDDDGSALIEKVGRKDKERGEVSERKEACFPCWT